MTGRTAPGWALLVTSVASVLVALDALAVTTALPAIGASLGSGLGTREWVVNAYTLAFAAGIVPATALGDRFGRRRVFTAGLALFTAASAGCALAPGAGELLAARALQGLGAATVAPLGLTILTGAFPRERRGAALGVWGGIGGLGVASGPLAGAALTQLLDWHWIFWVNVPLGVVAVVLAATRLPESRGLPAALDWRGMLLLTGAAGAAMTGLVAAGTSWTTPGTVVPLLAAVALTSGFVRHERRAVAPMLPLRLFRAPGFAPAVTTWVLMTATITAATFFVAQFFQLAQGDSPLTAGAHLLPWTVAPVLVAPLAGALADRTGRRPVLAAGMAAQALGLGWFALVAGPDAPYGSLLGPLLLAGFGISTAMPVAVGAALGGVPADEVGKASGVAGTLQRLGGGLGISVTAAVFAAHGSLGTAAAFTAGFRPALAAAAGFSLLGAVAALAVERTTPVGTAMSLRAIAGRRCPRPAAGAAARPGPAQVATRTTAEVSRWAGA